MTIAASFKLAPGLNLSIGSQAYMREYLGGARLSALAGIVVTYRW